MSKIPPQRIAASCNVFYLVVVNHGGFVCGKDKEKGSREATVGESRQVVCRDEGAVRLHGHGKAG